MGKKEKIGKKRTKTLIFSVVRLQFIFILSKFAMINMIRFYNEKRSINEIELKATHTHA